METILELKMSIARQVAMSYLGTWYKWGGDDPSGFDCSGFINAILKSIGLLDRGTDYTACGLADLFFDNKINILREGHLVFFGKAFSPGTHGIRMLRETGLKITHVEYMLDHFHSIGASGGGSNILTPEDAIKYNAFIKIRPVESCIFAVDPFLNIE